MYSHIILYIYLRVVLIIQLFDSFSRKVDESKRDVLSSNLVLVKNKLERVNLFFLGEGKHLVRD